MRLQETINGVPVLGAEKVVDLNANGDIRFASDKSLTDQAPRTSPTVSAATAKNVAVMAVAKSARMCRCHALRSTSPHSGSTTPNS